MTGLDLAIVGLYLGGIVAAGLLASRGERLEGHEGFFLAGRKLPWWVLGTSMVATTLAADTPLTVAGLTLSKGIAGNWFWWSMAVSHVLVAVMLGRLWRCSGVVTDAELCSLRYGARAGDVLRRVKAFWFAVPINCIVMGWVLLAMTKVAGAIWPGLPPGAAIAGLLALTLIYSVGSGFFAVVRTDLIQFPVAFGGAVLLCVLAVDAAGGLEAVVAAARAHGGDDALALFPMGSELLPWHTLVAFVAVQWWAQKYADGGGIFVQRLLAAKDERHAERGALWFCLAHYVLRPWPWILTGLAAIILAPDAVAADPEQAYAVLMAEVLPSGARGALVAAFLAAFMSTMDTHLNWGASYVVHDLLRRDSDPSAASSLRASRLSVVGICALALLASSMMDTIAGAWEFLVAFAAGAGPVVLLRWYWWRVTAAAELTAMVSSALLACAVWLWAPALPYLLRLLVIVGGSALLWLPLVVWRPPAPEALVPFFRRVRPPGPGWAPVARAAGLPLAVGLRRDLGRWIVGVIGVFAALLGTGHALLGAPVVGGLAAVAGVGALLWLSAGAVAPEEVSP